MPTNEPRDRFRFPWGWLVILVPFWLVMMYAIIEASYPRDVEPIAASELVNQDALP